MRPGRTDAYPDMPELDSGKTITLLDADVAGNSYRIHASHYYCKDEPLDLANSTVCASKIILRVWYDNEAGSSIALPFMDFLGDIEGPCARYQTLSFFRVAHSHNFRLKSLSEAYNHSVGKPLRTRLDWLQIFNIGDSRLPETCGSLCRLPERQDPDSP